MASGQQLTVELVEVGKDAIDLLERLGQLYKYDFSEFCKQDIRPDGKFETVGFGHIFSKPVHHVFLIQVGGALAGFAAMSEGSAYRDDDETVWYLDEFFVLRKFRGIGVGEEAASTLFGRYPGRWEIAQIRENIGAQAFWRNVIARYTGDRFEEVTMDDDQWRGPVQYFDSR